MYKIIRFYFNKPGNRMDELKEKRRTLVHDRFQVSCTYCGLLNQFPTKAQAFDYALRKLASHNTNEEAIEVFDCMAQKGKPNLWDAYGNIKEATA